jgi:RecA-family ATPase
VIFPMAGKDTRLMVKTRNQTVEKSPLYFALEQKIHDLGNVVFVGLDPALSLSEGEELDQGQQRALGKMADDLGVNTGAAVLLVSHATKASLQTEELQSHSSRGGGAITDAVRAEYVLRNMTGKEAVKANITDIEERHRHVQLVNTKGNKIPPAARVPVWLRRDDFGNLAEVEIIFDEKGHFTDREKKIIQTHIEMSVHSTVKLGDWRAECVKRGLVSGDTPKAQEKAMQRVLKNLSNLQMIQKGIGKGIYTITDLGKDTQ